MRSKVAAVTRYCEQQAEAEQCPWGRVHLPPGGQAWGALRTSRKLREGDGAKRTKVLRTAPWGGSVNVSATQLTLCSWDRGWVKRPAREVAFYPTAVVSNCKPGKRHALGGSLLSR